MDIPVNAEVSCLDGPCGRTTNLILNPTTEEITHVVVWNGSFPGTEYLVSIDHILDSTPKRITLNSSCEELSKMPIFNQVMSPPSNFAGLISNPYMMWPYFAPEAAYIPIENKHIPTNELAIRGGAGIEATDGHVGRVDEFLVNPGNDHITHLVLHEGHLWRQKKIAIPISQVDRIEENTVWLKLDKKSIWALPTIQVHRGKAKKV